MSDNAIVFDRSRVRQHRERAAAHFGEHDFLQRELAERMADRLEDVKRSFPLTLELGARTGILSQVLAGRGGIEHLVQADLSGGMLAGAQGHRVVADEELLPFADNSFDMVVSLCSLQWVNDLPGTLIQIQRVLKPEGFFLAMLPGGQTLRELREAFERAEAQVSGGISPRVSPFVDVRDGGSLLQRAGFQLPVVDSELLTIRYENPLVLLRDLRGGGETNALLKSQKSLTSRKLIYAVINEYLQLAGDDKRVPATLELVTLTGWKS